MYKKYYTEFLENHTGKVHLAAHSHHFWPDVTKVAVIESWNDSAKLSDEKWNHIFTNIVPKSQKLISTILNFTRPEDIAFAPNAHELLFRLLSCFIEKEECNILTTTSEFHSFSRQAKRCKELKSFNLLEINNEARDFEEQFLNSITKNTTMIYLSHVFFNSGLIISEEFIHKIIKKKSKETILCIDGYHSFCAIPVDLSAIENDIFFLSGGYKYAQAGEGCCFMTIPKDCTLRPLSTGWFASFETLEEPSTQVEYSNNGFRFWGSTQDLTPLYRFNAVWSMYLDLGIDIEQIHTYIQTLQTHFLDIMNSSSKFLNTDLSKQGHFLTTELPNSTLTKQCHKELLSHGIITDFRENRLRFGFGMYLDIEDLNSVIPRIKSILNKFNSLSESNN
jgi:selenocysteine lyase/cysteine desulfurase